MIRLRYLVLDKHILHRSKIAYQNLAVLLLAERKKNMVDMTQILNDILKAIFGKDVRQAIHDGIKRSNDIADDCDTRQTSLERQYDELLKNFSSSSPSAAEVVDARTGLDGTIYETLKKRLDDPRCS